MALVTFTDKVDSRIINVPAINKIVASDIKQLKDGVNTNEADIATNVTAIDLNTPKISFDSTSSNRLANTSGPNTGDQDLSGFRLITDSYTKTEINTLDTQNVKLTGTQTISGAKTFSANISSNTISGTSATFSSFFGQLVGTIASGTSATTQSSGDNSVSVATTAYVDNLGVSALTTKR